MYRPEGWENPYPDKPENYDWAIEDDIPSALALEMRQRAFEAGADAFLEALRKQGEHKKAGDWIEDAGQDDYGNLVDGTWVFIPDDTKKGN